MTFTYGTLVKVIFGFYIGCTGEVVEGPDRKIAQTDEEYLVELYCKGKESMYCKNKQWQTPYHIGRKKFNREFLKKIEKIDEEK